MRVNIPIAVGSVWLTNPVTMGPIFYAEYRLGAWMLGTPTGDWHFELSWRWLTEEAGRIWEPMLAGTLVFAVTAAVLGYVILNRVWMVSVMRRYRERPHFTSLPKGLRKY